MDRKKLMSKRRSTTFKGDNLMSTLGKNLLKKTLAAKMAENSEASVSRQNSREKEENSRSSINSEKDKKMRRGSKARTGVKFGKANL
jgi:hypothetical protein